MAGFRSARLAVSVFVICLTTIPALARNNPPSNGPRPNLERTKKILKLLNEQAARLPYLQNPAASWFIKNRSRSRRRSHYKSYSSSKSYSSLDDIFSGLSRTARITATKGFSDTLFSRSAILPSDEASWSGPVSSTLRTGVTALSDSVADSAGALKGASASLSNVMAQFADFQSNQLPVDQDTGKDEDGADQVAPIIDDTENLPPLVDEGFAPIVEDNFAPIVERSGLAPAVKEDITTGKSGPSSTEPLDFLVEDPAASNGD